MTRCFISVSFPKAVVEKLKKIQNQLPEFIGKKTEQENLHLTLKFLGEISEEEIKKIKKALGKIKFKKFSASINSIGVFSGDFIRIIWLRITNCEELQKNIDEILEKIGYGKEQRFMSHLTIARVKNIKEDKKEFLEKLKKIKIPEIKIDVDKFEFKSSTLTKKGPVYEDVGVYELK